MLKKLSLALLSILITALAGISQTATQPNVDDIEALSNKWMEAAKDHDLKTLDALMASDFKLVRASQDKPTTRAEWFEALERLDTRSFRYEHFKVARHGDTFAVANSVFTTQAIVDGQTFTPVAAVTDVWEKRNGKWQIVTRYAARPEELRAATAKLEKPD